MDAETLIRTIAAETCAVSELPAVYLPELEAGFVNHILPHVRQFSDYLDAHEFIYENKMTEHQSVFRADGFAFLIPAALLRGKYKTPVTQLIVSDYRATTPEYIPVLHSQLAATITSFRDSLNRYYMSTRVFSGERPEPEYPSDEWLEEWYKCLRKAVYSTEEETEAHLSAGHMPYRCAYGDHWHQGTPVRVRDDIPEEIHNQRYKHTWRRLNNV
jgi:hypothetical protein